MWNICLNQTYSFVVLLYVVRLQCIKVTGKQQLSEYTRTNLKSNYFMINSNYSSNNYHIMNNNKCTILKC